MFGSISYLHKTEEENSSNIVDQEGNQDLFMKYKYQRKQYPKKAQLLQYTFPKFAGLDTTEIEQPLRYMRANECQPEFTKSVIDTNTSYI